jgi:hypothetical protein
MTNTSTDARSISATKAYRIPELAQVLDSGVRGIYAAIRTGKLRAAKINDRGDLRVLGSWALEYLEEMAAK